MTFTPCFSTTTTYSWSNLQYFNDGLISLASSTIRNGTQLGGLTINAGATITNDLITQGSETSTIAGKLLTSSGIGLADGYISRFSNIFTHRPYIVCAPTILITAGCDYTTDGIADDVEIQAT